MENQDNSLFFPANDADYHYLNNFKEALGNTENLGFHVPKFTIDFGFKPDLEELYERVEDIVYMEEHDPQNQGKLPAFNCFLYAQSVCAGLAKFYGQPPMLTSGYLLGDSRKTFYEPLTALTARLKNESNKRVNLHVWVTLPDFTVVDPTLIPSLRRVSATSSRLAKDLFIRNVREQHRAEDFCYQPVLVGREYWDKANVEAYTY